MAVLPRLFSTDGYGVFMGLTYFKRFRMEIDLRRAGRGSWPLASDYRFVPWDGSLVEEHAEIKYESFRLELDADVFPCLGELDGCSRLMNEISQKEGFLPEATWLLEYVGAGPQRHEFCGTVQGISGNKGRGSIQNVGITPHHRGRGLGLALVSRSLEGFRQCGVRRVYLEVTAQNTAAVKLYQRIGFHRVRTLYKAVEVAVS